MIYSPVKTSAADIINFFVKRRVRSTARRRVIASFVQVSSAAALVTGSLAQPADVPVPRAGNFELCRTIADPTARLKCYERATSSIPQSEQPSAAAPPTPGAGAEAGAGSEPAAGLGNWRLVRTPNPRGGQEAVSIMQTADIAKSDIDLAGLMIRCRDHLPGTEVVIVLLTPLPPRAHPKVTVRVGGASEDFSGTIVPPGAEVLLPPEASALVSDSGTTAHELSVEVNDQSQQVKGVIPLAGLGQALPMLSAGCSSQ